jgi:membrane-bound ClpP family serine protease
MQNANTPAPISERLKFGKRNFQLLYAGIAFIVLGFIIMSLDTEPYGFGFFGLTLGPILLAIGFAIPFWAIMYKEKESEKTV